MSSANTQLFDYLYEACVHCLSKIERKHVWLVVARYLFNKHELCENGCEDEIHFHDAEDWFKNQKELDKFWAEFADKDESEELISDIMQFIETKRADIVALLAEQKQSAHAVFRALETEDAKEYLDFLWEERRTIKRSFCFYCAMVCTVMEMQDKENLGTIPIFEVFFRYFLDDYDEEDEDVTDTKE